jgi:predicted ATPase
MRTTSPIKQFQVLGLHGDRNITLDFEGAVKILVDVNGAGKTTVLNILFHLLSGNFFRLGQFDFKKIILQFSEGEPVDIDHADLELSDPIDILRSRLPPREFDRIVMAAMEYPPFEFERRAKEAFEKIDVDPNLDSNDLRYLHEKIRHRPGGRNHLLSTPKKTRLRGKLQNIETQLRARFPHQVLYFPTYRRIEEDLQRLGYVERGSNREEQLIQFGMQDVKTRFEQITSEIRNSSVEWYSKINGEMATQLIRGIQRNSIDFDKFENPEAFQIVFDRIGKNMSDEDKKQILELIRSKTIKQDNKYELLAFFLSNLIKVYEQQSDNDNAINEFASVSNGYLDYDGDGDKEIRYNESKVEIKVVSKKTGQEISLDKLSSGEKQVVSIFSRLFLEQAKSYAILFDEPELSLSMEWQKKLLADIVKSSKCAFLLAATHSPFIFENELDQYADQLKVEFLETTNESSR